jgi:hypothetical protein
VECIRGSRGRQVCDSLLAGAARRDCMKVHTFRSSILPTAARMETIVGDLCDGTARTGTGQVVVANDRAQTTRERRHGVATRPCAGVVWVGGVGAAVSVAAVVHLRHAGRLRGAARTQSHSGHRALAAHARAAFRRLASQRSRPPLVGACDGGRFSARCIAARTA